MGSNTMLDELLRLTHDCEVVMGRRKCKERAVIRFDATHPKREIQTAYVCRKHADQMRQIIRTAGYELTERPA